MSLFLIMQPRKKVVKVPGCNQLGRDRKSREEEGRKEGESKETLRATERKRIFASSTPACDGCRVFSKAPSSS